jgi:hypothetical protein
LPHSKEENITMNQQTHVVIWLSIVAGLAAAMFWPCGDARAELTVTDPRCEYRVDPLGIDTAAPRLSWVLASNQRAQMQTAYHVLVASSRGELDADRGDLWDSGRVASDRSVLVHYAGKPLASLATCHWKVRAWDKQDRPSAWSEPARWTTGLLQPADWKARWIVHPEDVATPPGPTTALPLLRREFQVDKPVVRAIVSLCGLGQHELHFNGRKVGDNVMEPGWTNYRKRCLYVTYDVTDRIVPGRNAVGVMLGNGMYNVVGGRYVKFTGSMGPPKMIAQMRLDYADGTSDVIGSDATWKAARGPITFSCIYGGEDHDARRDRPGWDQPGFDEADWQPAAEVDGPGGVLRAQTLPIKVTQTFKPAKITRLAPGLHMVDLGQNFSGWPRIKVSGPAGATVRLVPGELLDDKGRVTQASSGGPVSFNYTLRGEGQETWSPRFSYYGFRYVQVEGATRDGDPAEDMATGDAAKPVLEDIEGQFTHLAAERVGQFSCSNTLWNRIHGCIDMAIRSNMQSVITDCPHREKLGWLEVSHLLGPAIMFNYDVPLLYAKISDDMSESQTADGLVPDIAPEYTVFNEGFRDSPSWGSACVVNPWLAWRRYGDRRMLEEHWPRMVRYVDYLTSRAEGHIVSHGLGDWCDLGPAPYGAAQLTPIALTSTATYYHDLTILARAAELLGKPDDQRRYTALADKVRDAFNAKFFDTAAGQYGTGSQTSNAMPLVLGLVEPSRASGVIERLVEDVRRRGDHMTGGDVGFRFMLVALMQAGRSDVIAAMANRTDLPSYGFQIEHGVTALSETWDPRVGNSQNHCMLGHLEEWFGHGLVGINPGEDKPGYQHSVVRPRVVDGVDWAEGSYRSVHGRIACRWERQGDRLIVKMTIPANTTATVYVPARSPEAVTESGVPAAKAEGVTPRGIEPGCAVYAVGSGEYEFSARIVGTQ